MGMLSITGLEFSYSQSPESMKSVLQAAWLLTVAFGNVIVILIAHAKAFNDQASEFFMFDVLMFIDMGISSVMAYFYKYTSSEDLKRKHEHVTTCTHVAPWVHQAESKPLNTQLTEKICNR